MRVSDVTEATKSLDPDLASGTAQLLVVDGADSTIMRLPQTGTLSIGRAPECEIRLNDPACSRRHARLHVADGDITLEDLGSHNGTRLNGERVEGRRTLASDDVIGIGPIKLVLSTSARQRRSAILDSSALRERLTQEVERATSYERPLSVLVLVVAPGVREAVAAALLAAVRMLDVVGVLDERHLAILMPEIVPEAGRAAAHEILAIVQTLGVTAGGLAHCPSDASRPDALVAAARSASAIGAGLHEADESVLELELGDTIALVADASMIQVYDLLRRLAASDLSVFISGETGVGKEAAAHALHVWSKRVRAPFVAINCASLPETLVESELFGYEKGAFSGATATKIGRLEAAHGGSVFFDEIGELPLATQSKLLRVLQSRQVLRLGALKEQPVDIRVIAATNRNIEAEVRAGRFREDLFFRLSGAKVVLPPLRDRPRELAILARHFLSTASRPADSVPLELSTAALTALGRHCWSGNVRELKNEMEFLAATVSDPVVEPWHLSERITSAIPETVSRVSPIPAASVSPSLTSTPIPTHFRPIQDEMRDLERRRMTEALAAAGGVQKRAAELIGMPLRTFTMKYKQYGFKDR